MPDTNELIVALANNDMVKAGASFNSIMNDKISSALDDAKVHLAQGMMGVEDTENVDAYEDDEV